METMSKEAWDKVAQKASAGRPSVGKTVKVTFGKYTGRTGKVVWHGANKFKPSRYGSPAQQDLRDLIGIGGYRVGILTDDGDKFFVDADKVEIVEAA